jgi:L-threonylcarbamoyladenylate synthase
LRATAPQPAPGQLQRHYAPRAALTLYIGEAARVGERIANDARAAAASGLRVGILAPREDLLALAPRLAAAAASGRIVTKRYGSRSSPDDAAHDLYAALRDLDADHPDVILAAAIEGEGIGAAVVDRLTRAAEGRVVKT